MQAYKKEDLYNKLVQQQSSNAFEAQQISADTYKSILAAHPSALYTPNFFIRIALGLLTIVAVLFSSLLIWLISGADHDDAFVILSLFLSLASYAALELFVHSKRLYNAGVDNVLMCISILFLIAAFLTEDYANNNFITSLVLMLYSLWLCIRFADAFMAGLSAVALYIFIFLLCINAGPTGKAIAPFVMMFVCTGIYMIAHILLKKKNLLLYHFSCRVVELLALVLLYGSVNFYVVNEAGKQMFSSSTVTMPAAVVIILWLCTLAIPPVYIVYGILKKDIVVLRTGIMLLIVAVLTIRYYYAMLPPEVDMLIGGIVTIGISYTLILYLRTAKHRFTFENTRPNKKAMLNAEALIIAQVFGKPHTQQQSFEYGGGSSGGAGAGGDY